ncbi:MAG: DNA polymerase I [Chlamydiota bacterium]|nr:DNA polymerase I [Chlamydiota bacterium]
MHSLPVLYIIDGTSLIYKSFYAVPPLSNSKGQATNAILGFIKTLEKFISEKNPHYLAIALDAKGPTFRHERYLDYKAHRKPMPDELVCQIPLIRNFILCRHIPLLEIQGCEADDTMASLASRLKSNAKVIIISNDKDMLQIVNQDISVIQNIKENIILDENEIKEKYGVRPDQIRDLLALSGDSSDNIPGLPGIGVKSAATLLQKYESIEGIMKNLNALKGRVKKEMFENNLQVLELSRDLATIRTDIPCPLELADCQLKEPDYEKLQNLYRELEFKDLLRNISKPDLNEAAWVMMDDGSLKEIQDRLLKAQHLAFALDIKHEELHGMALAFNKQDIAYISCEHSKGLEFIEDVLKTNLLKISFDIKNSIHILKTRSLQLQGPYFDIMIASHLVNTSFHPENLNDCALHYIGKTSRESGPETDEPKTICHRTSLMIELFNHLWIEIQKLKLQELAINLEMPLIHVLADMEAYGIRLDQNRLSALSHFTKHQLAQLELDIHHLAGESFQISSTKELSRILFETLKLHPLKRTKTGYSTDVDALQSLRHHHPIAEKLLEYRQLSKLMNTYIDVLPTLVNTKTGLLHTHFNQSVTATGRLSSSTPNLQNIPVRNQFGRMIRESFIPPHKHEIFFSADYSQIELRILAHFSRDPMLLKAFEQKEDIHRWTAHHIYGVNSDQVTDEMRNRAKTVNFGILYGMSAFGLSRQLSISIDEAQYFMNRYFERFPTIKNFIQTLLEETRKKGYVTTILNRIRLLPEINNSQKNIRQMAERMAINTPIQGSAADIIKMAMLTIHEKLLQSHLQSKLVLQIHDELIFCVPEPELVAVSELVVKTMEHIIALNVQLKVDVKQGRNWGELK